MEHNRDTMAKMPSKTEGPTKAEHVGTHTQSCITENVENFRGAGCHQTDAMVTQYPQLECGCIQSQTQTAVVQPTSEVQRFSHRKCKVCQSTEHSQ